MTRQLEIDSIHGEDFHLLADVLTEAEFRLLCDITQAAFDAIVRAREPNTPAEPENGRLGG